MTTACAMTPASCIEGGRVMPPTLSFLIDFCTMLGIAFLAFMLAGTVLEGATIHASILPLCAFVGAVLKQFLWKGEKDD